MSLPLELMDRMVSVTEISQGKASHVPKMTLRLWRTYAFSGRMICSVCGGKYRRIKERGPEGATIWRCIANVHCAGQCTGRVVLEEEAQKTVLEVLDELAQINQTLPRLTSFQ